MRDTTDIIGVSFDKITMSLAVARVGAFLQENKIHTIFTPNAEIMMDTRTDPHLKSILNSADLLIADGAGVVLAARILGRPLPEKVSGIDLTRNSFSTDFGRKVRYFLFGSKPGVAEIAAENLLNKYPGIEIAGCRSGYFAKEDESSIISQINSSGTDILLVALGAPKQEKWINDNKERLQVKVCIGVGGILDVFAGKIKPAPEFLRRNGLEWLYRLYKEPWRYKRMLKLPKFILLAIAIKLGLKS